MSRYLLDVSVLLALHWPRHTAHSKTLHWFRGTPERAFSTCAMTQAGFIRIITNPAFLEDRIAHHEALLLLEEFTSLKGHIFWGSTISYAETTAPLTGRVIGHRQVTDAYLLGLAIREKGILATLDRGTRHLAGDEFARNVLVIE